MSTILPVALQPGVTLGTAPTAICTAPTGKVLTIKRAAFVNVGVGTVSLTVTSTRSGGAALVVILARGVPAGGIDLAPELSAWVLSPGDALSATASAAGAVNCFINGMIVG